MEIFTDAVSKFVNHFKETKQIPIRIVTNNTVDGVLSTAILIRALEKDDLNFSVCFVKELKDQKLQELNYDSAKTILFLGTGSKEIGRIVEFVKNKQIFIIDNSEEIDKSFNVNTLNPCLEGEKISLSALTYLLAKQINPKNSELVHLGFIGSLFIPSGYDHQLLKEAIETKKILVSRGLQFFYGQTQEVTKVLESSFYPYLPNISGNIKTASNFIREINVNQKKFIDLSEDELKRLYASIIVKMLGKETKKEVFGPIYLLANEKDDSVIKDVRGFVNVIDACCRTDKGSIAVGMCLDEPNFKREAMFIFQEFKEEVIKCLDWFYNNRKSDRIIEKETLVILKFESDFPNYIVDFVMEIIRKSAVFKKGTILCSLCYTVEGVANVTFLSASMDTKYSKEIFYDIVKALKLEDYEIGDGLKVFVAQHNEEEFMKNLVLRLENRKIEEIVHS